MHSFYSALMAGVMTGLGGAAFLGADNRHVGAFLFAIGMFACLTLGLPLFVGRGARALCDTPKRFHELLPLVALNLLGAGVCGILYGLAVPTGVDLLQAGKLAQPWWATLIRGLLCGMILFTAGESWRLLKEGKPVGVLLGVPAFVLAGLENSVADAFYFGAGLGQTGVFAPRTILFVILAVIGNILGAALLYKALPADKKAAPAP